MGSLTWLRNNWLPLVLLGGVIAAFIFLRHSPTPGIDSLPALDEVVNAGQPTLIEFYSNF